MDELIQSIAVYANTTTTLLATNVSTLVPSTVTLFSNTTTTQSKTCLRLYV